MRTTIFAFGVMMVVLGFWGKYLEKRVVVEPVPLYNMTRGASSATDCSKSSPYEPKDICE